MTMIDPRTPRFGATVVMALLLLGVGLQEPPFIVAVAVILNVLVVSGWRFDLFDAVWRHGLVPLVGEPETTEPAIPHRFATLVVASMSTLAVILLYVAPVIGIEALTLAGYAVALGLSGVTALSGLGGYCIGCRMYRQVSFFRRLGILG